MATVGDSILWSLNVFLALPGLHDDYDDDKGTYMLRMMNALDDDSQCQQLNTIVPLQTLRMLRRVVVPQLLHKIN